MSRRALLLPVLALPLLLVLAAFADEDTVRDFERYFRKFEDGATRVEAVLALEGEQHPSVVRALLPVLRDDDPDVARAAVRVLSQLEEPAAVAAFTEALAKSKKSEERAGLLAALAAGRFPPSPELAEAVAESLEDRDWSVRRRAVWARASLGGEGVDAALVPLLEDKEVAVRCAAVEALASLRSRAVVEPAIAALASDVWQERASAIAALGTVRDARSIPPLIGRMEVEEGRLVEDIGRALEKLTARGFGSDVAGWRRFWDTFGDRFVMPSDAELAKLEAANAETRAKYEPPGAVAYHGISTPSRSIVFVIDVSGSMENLVVEREKFEGGGYANFTRMEIVKTELARTIEGLEDFVKFNVLAFASDVDPWRKELVPANALQKTSAIEWVKKLEPLGGNADADLAEVGLGGTADLAAGKTNTHAAILSALGADPLAEAGEQDEDYEVEVDTIFFLSDGYPTHGRYVDPTDILRDVRRANELRKVVIHVIAIGEFQKAFMKRLASENDGVFVDLGR